MNVILPRSLAIGAAEVALLHHGEVMDPARTITIEPALLFPRVALVCDAKNVAMEMSSESGGVKVLIEDLEDPAAIEFQLGGWTVEDVDVTRRVAESRVPGRVAEPRAAAGPPG